MSIRRATGRKNSSMGIHLIMPMGGSGSRFSERGFSLPKPLIPIQGHPFFYWATESVHRFIKLSSLTFVVLLDHIKQFDIDKVIYEYYPDAKLHVLERVLNGAVLTCLEGIKTIHDEKPVLFNDCDHIFKSREFYEFCEKQKFDDVDGILLYFRSIDPKFSFVELDETGNVLSTVEKEAVSDKAICGAYYFRNRALFEKATNVYLSEYSCKEFFISGVYNIMASQGANIRSFSVDMHLSFGTPEEYDLALKSEVFDELIS